LQSGFLLGLIYVAYNVSPRICDSDFSFFLSPDNNFDVVLFKIKTDINEELFFSLTKLKLYHSHAMKTGSFYKVHLFTFQRRIEFIVDRYNKIPPCRLNS
jgi:hypothetical protein